jgi:hypothetical protein
MYLILITNVKPIPTSKAPEKMKLSHVGKKISILWKLKFHYRVHNTLSHGFILSQLKTFSESI